MTIHVVRGDQIQVGDHVLLSLPHAFGMASAVETAKVTAPGYLVNPGSGEASIMGIETGTLFIVHARQYVVLREGS